MSRCIVASGERRGLDSQLTTIPNKTPMTKSQTVMVTMILIIVMYSILPRFRISKTNS